MSNIERNRETARGEERIKRKEEKRSWQPIPMQIHFKALLERMGSDSTCSRVMGVLGGDLET